MTTWAPSKRARSERIEAEADGLIRDLGDCAYQEARRREHEASSDATAEDWALVAKAIARKTDPGERRAAGRATDGRVSWCG